MHRKFRICILAAAVALTNIPAPTVYAAGETPAESREYQEATEPGSVMPEDGGSETAAEPTDSTGGQGISPADEGDLQDREETRGEEGILSETLPEEGTESTKGTESADGTEEQEMEEGLEPMDGKENIDGTVEQEVLPEGMGSAVEAAEGDIRSAAAYLPYEGAKYTLAYEGMEEGIRITGVADWDVASENALGELSIPAEIDGVAVTEIAVSAFDEWKGFSGDLTIPDSVRKIGDYAFSGCSGFNGGLHISENVEEIGKGAFSGCSGLVGDLTVPDSVVKLGSEAFMGCTGFRGGLKLSTGLTEICDSVFSSCQYLTGILELPGGLTSIGESAFENCKNFTGSLVIPSGVTVIGKSAFQSCIFSQGRLVLPGSVAEIGEFAFSGC